MRRRGARSLTLRERGPRSTATSMHRCLSLIPPSVRFLFLSHFRFQILTFPPSALPLFPPPHLSVYCLRAMVNLDNIPLNQGALVPITVKLPSGSCLNPSPTAAVVGGNVCTSQRVTDVVLKAFKAAAASQGCCALPSPPFPTRPFQLSDLVLTSNPCR